MRICFATGRNFAESAEIVKATAHYDLGVFAGGALVVDTATGELIHSHRMNAALACELSAALESAGHAVLALQERDAEGIEYLVSDGLPLQSAFIKWLEWHEQRRRMVPRGELARFDHANTLRLSIAEQPQVIEAVQRQLDERFGQRIVHHAIHVPVHGVDVLEIFDPAATKWSGIERVARIRQVDPARIIAVGDDVNDLPMLKSAGLGVAMGNARPLVQSAAGRVIGSNAEDGLAVFLEEIATARNK